MFMIKNLIRLLRGNRAPTFKDLRSMSGEEAKQLILQGKAPKDITTEKPLNFNKKEEVVIPEGLKAPSLTIHNGNFKSLPDNIKIKNIKVRSNAFTTLGQKVECDFLDLSHTAITELPPDLKVNVRIDLEGCRRLVSLPPDLTIGSLNLQDCSSLEMLPENLHVTFLDLAGCTALTSLPKNLHFSDGRLNLRNCAFLSRLPANLGTLSELDISGCINITELPSNLKIASWIDFAGSGVTKLPEGFEDVGLRWHGVSVSKQIVFEPEALTIDEILNETNAEVRRIMMERFGYDKLFEQAEAEVIDHDEDKGGERKLLRIELEDDEDLVCVYVQCPSTQHKFILRVPPTVSSCHQAVAWTAGYDDPDQYKPLHET